MHSIVKKDEEVEIPFMWKDRFHNFHMPKAMETRHLFFTLRMIWNNFMPESAKIRPYNAYSFSKFYTPEYLREAIKELGMELGTRKDLSEIMKYELQWMIDWLRINQVQGPLSNLVLK